VDARVPSAQNKAETVSGLVDFFMKPKAGKEQTGGTYKRRSTSKKGSKKGSKKKGKKGKKGKKDTKKRGITGYILFGNEIRPKLKKKDPNLNFTEVAQALSKKWKKLDDDEKEEYNKRAKKENKKKQEAAKSDDDDDDEEEESKKKKKKENKEK